MKLGDVVLTQGELWKVTLHSREYRTFTLMSWSGSKFEVPDTPVPEVQVRHTPQTWPFMSLPMRPGKGQIILISRNGTSLVPLRDWVPSGMHSSGGSIFFNPDLCLCVGELLIVEHLKGRSSAKVKLSFASLKSRKQKAVKPFRPRKPLTAYSRLLSDSDLFEDDA